ncbi:MAG TPA: hypothetical protein VNL13_04175 [Sulfolobales archaeon]|nr:hypothetical protein [Sulfolobales archaeon]
MKGIALGVGLLTQVSGGYGITAPNHQGLILDEKPHAAELKQP